MKRFTSLWMALVLLASLASCAAEAPDADIGALSEEAPAGSVPGQLSPSPAPTQAPARAEDDSPKVLIAYFTWADNTVVDDAQAAIDSALDHYASVGDSASVDATSSASVVVPGNAAQLAGWIQAEVGGDLHSIIVEDIYPSDYDQCLDRAADELAENARPTLSTRVENMEDYDIVFLGFPNWWYTVPMPVLSFVEEYDWSGKTVIPFVTHGTGGLSRTVRDLTAALPDDVTVLDAIGVYRADTASAQADIQMWINAMGLGL